MMMRTRLSASPSSEGTRGSSRDSAGRGLGHAFFDQEFEAAQRVVDNISGTIYLSHKIGRDMRSGSDSDYGFDRRAHSGVLHCRVPCLAPGATESEFFERANMMDTKVGQGDKDDPADVARIEFDTMMRGRGGW